MSFSFWKASDRNTQCFMVNINGHCFKISYQTVVGYSGPLGKFCRDNIWGPTTGKHMKELRCHPKADGYTVVSEDEMNEIINKATGREKPLSVTRRIRMKVNVRFAERLLIATVAM